MQHGFPPLGYMHYDRQKLTSCGSPCLIPGLRFLLAPSISSKRLGSPGFLSSIEEGLPSDLVGEVEKRLDLTPEEMASFLGVSPRTLERRRKNGSLSPVESERLYRIVRLFRKATEVFESEKEARRWLKRPQMRLGEQVPLEIARLEPGARETERLLGRIEHGIPA